MLNIPKKLFILFTLIAFVFLAASCNGSQETDGLTAEQKKQTVKVSGDGIEGKLSFTLEELAALSGGVFEHAYSTINKWPTSRFYAAKGIRIDKILEAAGVLETANLIIFRSEDGYEMSFTRKQLLDEPHYYYPLLLDGSPDGAERVFPILAYEYRENSKDLEAVRPERFCLIIGQRNHLEHSNPAFVANVAELIVSSAPPERWEAATIWPASGQIQAGDNIKLQHPSFGLVKLFYTTDGTDPTELSTMYNPSTYQPELNKPVVFTQSAVLKVLVVGYGKEDSEIAAFEITVK